MDKCMMPKVVEKDDGKHGVSASCDRIEKGPLGTSPSAPIPSTDLVYNRGQFLPNSQRSMCFESEGRLFTLASMSPA